MRTDLLPGLALGLVLACSALAAPAAAAPKKAAVKQAPQGKAAAKKAAQAARRAFDLGRFDEALMQYEEAYRLMSVPALFFNIGQCHRQLGNEERAVYFFRRYLESQPPAAQARATEALIEQLEATAERKRLKVEAERVAARQMELERARAEAANAEAAAAEKRRQADEMARRAAEADTRKTTARNIAVERALTTPAPPAVEQDVPVTRRWWFWTAIGAAVAAGVGAGVYVATAPQPLPTTYPDINGR